jgi:hypothetical protein
MDCGRRAAPHPRFTEWVVRKGLLESPFVFIDVGVQGGIHPRWLHLGPSLRVYGFDPLEETIGPLTRLNLPNHTYQAIALGDADGERDFFVPGESFPRLHFFRARPSRIRCAWRSTLVIGRAYKRGACPCESSTRSRVVANVIICEPKAHPCCRKPRHARGERRSRALLISPVAVDFDTEQNVSILQIGTDLTARNKPRKTLRRRSRAIAYTASSVAMFCWRATSCKLRKR